MKWWTSFQSGETLTVARGFILIAVYLKIVSKGEKNETPWKVRVNNYSLKKEFENMEDAKKYGVRFAKKHVEIANRELTEVILTQEYE